MYTCIFVVKGYESYLFTAFFLDKLHHGQLIELKAFTLVAADQHTQEYDTSFHGLFTVTLLETGTIEELFPALDNASRTNFSDTLEYVKVHVTELVHTCKEVQPYLLEPHLITHSV